MVQERDETKVWSTSVEGNYYSWEAFEIQTLFKVDTRNVMKFWEDMCKDSFSSKKFIDLYAIASSKEAWMKRVIVES